ncbi:phosphatase PAP2 family protein [Asanoa siamensis]|uniref:Phosphoesterase n=1 Tax=Asanoa siamensis TaxID=926357 RepID=A0ABQ4CMF5_9ACTN|nr:phosphatase PAP2 family protein [Asanoa siamensis]GIF72022.1 phosphoesterase [Asanoa siamensis]
MNPRSPAAARLLAAAAACAVAFCVTWLLFVRTSTGQWLDGELLPRSEMGGSYAQPTILLGPATQALGLFGDRLLLGTTVAVLAVVAVLTRRLWAGVAGVALFVCSAAAAGLAKETLQRPELGVLGSSTHNSFPSGHVTAAAALLLGFMLVLPARARWWLAVPGTTGVSVIAAATMIVGWHRFSDVVGSLLLVATLFCVAAAALSRLPGQEVRPEDDDSAVTGLLLQAIALTLLVMLSLALAPDAGLRLLLAIVAVSGTTLVVVSGALWLAQPAIAPAQEDAEPTNEYSDTRRR